MPWQFSCQIIVWCLEIICKHLTSCWQSCWWGLSMWRVTTNNGAIHSKIMTNTICYGTLFFDWKIWHSNAMIAIILIRGSSWVIQIFCRDLRHRTLNFILKTSVFRFGVENRCNVKTFLCNSHIPVFVLIALDGVNGNRRRKGSVLCLRNFRQFTWSFEPRRMSCFKFINGLSCWKAITYNTKRWVGVNLLCICLLRAARHVLWKSNMLLIGHE